jgi:hypothetical protein
MVSSTYNYVATTAKGLIIRARIMTHKAVNIVRAKSSSLATSTRDFAVKLSKKTYAALSVMVGLVFVFFRDLFVEARNLVKDGVNWTGRKLRHGTNIVAVRFPCIMPRKLSRWLLVKLGYEKSANNWKTFYYSEVNAEGLVDQESANNVGQKEKWTTSTVKSPLAAYLYRCAAPVDVTGTTEEWSKKTRPGYVE